MDQVSVCSRHLCLCSRLFEQTFTLFLLFIELFSEPLSRKMAGISMVLVPRRSARVPLKTRLMSVNKVSSHGPSGQRQDCHALTAPSCQSRDDKRVCVCVQNDCGKQEALQRTHTYRLSVCLHHSELALHPKTMLLLIMEECK